MKIINIFFIVVNLLTIITSAYNSFDLDHNLYMEHLRISINDHERLETKFVPLFINMIFRECTFGECSDYIKDS